MNSDFIDINLLPHPVRPALGGPAWRRLMIPGFLLLLLALALTFGAFLLKIRNDQVLAEQQAEMEAMSEEVRDFSTIMAEVEVLQQQITTLAIQAEQLEADAERVNQENPSLAPFLRVLAETLLPRMSVTGIVASSPARYVVQGEAGSNSLVIEYANALKQRPEIRSVTIRSVEQLGGDAAPATVRWTIEVER
ncbi:MAG: hypothetical protein M3220_07405 [Chloroflexota bacterium]|nr:hypothetical protein [Chloroflexota bacterium]